MKLIIKRSYKDIALDVEPDLAGYVTEILLSAVSVNENFRGDDRFTYDPGAETPITDVTVVSDIKAVRPDETP